METMLHSGVRAALMTACLGLCACGSVVEEGQTDGGGGEDAAAPTADGGLCQPSSCDPNATCDDSGGVIECTCNDGFEGDGASCSDVDECAQGTDDCDAIATCTNSEGGFECQCPETHEDVNGDGTRCELPPFPASFFPVTIPEATGGWGDIDRDDQGNLLVPGQVAEADLFEISVATGGLSSVATAVGDQVISVVYDPDTDTIYAGARGGDIYEVDENGNSSLLVNVGQDVNSLALSPAGYGDLGDFLLAATAGNSSDTGILFAIDPANPGNPLQVVSGEGWLSDLAFAADGTLYAARYQMDVAAVVTIGAGGDVSEFLAFTGPCGIAIDDAGGRMFVGDAQDDLLYEVPLSNPAKTSLGSYNFDSGYLPCGLEYDGHDTLLMAVGGDGESELRIEAHTLQ